MRTGFLSGVDNRVDYHGCVAIILPMTQNSAKRVAKVKTTLTKRTVEALEPAEKSWIAWDDKLTGFGVRKSSGAKMH